jgi:diguanylate cyclase (GGDEF)-like protein
VPDVETKSRILVIDDDPEPARMLAVWFAGEPYEVVEATGGMEGLRLAEEQGADLILLDLRMPDLDGLTVARRLRQLRTTQDVPIVLLTACGDAEVKARAFSVGADDYLVKPFECLEIDARIRAMLRRRAYLKGLETEIRTLSTTKDRLESLLMVDDKTGLYNFREFRRRLHDEWQRAQRYGGPLSLVFLDLDHFKRVNDTFGHQAGDTVLREFATLVAGGARTNDVAARYGGEEFAVILPHTDGPMAERVAERIRTAVEAFEFLDGEPRARVTVSAGVATYPAPGDAIRSIDDFVSRADRALYRAKETGRNRVVRDGEEGAPPSDRDRSGRRAYRSADADR